MNGTPEEHVSAHANGSSGEVGRGSLPFSVSRRAEPFTPVRRGTWRHFTHCLRHYADFSGRATRAEYWSFQTWGQGIGFLLILMAVGVFSVLSSSVLKEAVGTGELARYVEIAASEGVLGFTRELVESAPVVEVEGIDANTSGTLAETVEGDFVLPSSQAQTPWFLRVGELNKSAESTEHDEVIWEACLAWVQYLKDSYAWLAEESMYPSIMLASAAVLLSFFCLWSLGTFIPLLAVTWRRLHDIGLSGAWFLLSFIPGTGGLILFVMTLLDSQPGSNRFGPPTKYP